MTGLLFMLTFFATFLTISSSNPVYAVLGLISLFTFTSSYLILLGLGFIGISYLLIYVGAIAILFLFVVMMMNLKFLTYHLLPNFLPLATLITIFFFFSNFSFFFLFDSFNFFFFSPLNYPWSCLFNSSHHLTSLAYPLYSSFSLWLLFSSLLLLLAMIAPIILILPSSQHSLPNSSCKTSIPTSSSHSRTHIKLWVRSKTSKHSLPNSSCKTSMTSKHSLPNSSCKTSMTSKHSLPNSSCKTSKPTSSSSCSPSHNSNIEYNSYLICFVLEPKDNKKNSNYYSSSFQIANNLDLSIMLKLFTRCNKFYCNKFITDKYLKNINREKLCIITTNDYINYQTDNLYVININTFISEFKSQSTIDSINFNIRINITNYILIGISWSDFIQMMKDHGIYITGGPTEKRHILSSVHFRLYNLYQILIFILSYNKNYMILINRTIFYNTFFKPNSYKCIDLFSRFWNSNSITRKSHDSYMSFNFYNNHNLYFSYHNKLLDISYYNINQNINNIKDLKVIFCLGVDKYNNLYTSATLIPYNSTIINDFFFNKYKIIVSKDKNFLDTMKLYDINEFHSLINRHFFILDGISWSDFNQMMKDHGMPILCNKSKRHILSPLQMRLIYMCMSLNIHIDIIRYGFHTDIDLLSNKLKKPSDNGSSDSSDS